jgi:hypothetical protein
MATADIIILMLLGSPVALIFLLIWLTPRKANQERTLAIEGGSSPAAPAPPREPSEIDTIIERERQRMNLLSEAWKIIWDYAGVVGTLDERFKATGKLLYPESLLPHPKETISRAFSRIYEEMERIHVQHWNGFSKDIYFRVEMALDQFAPDDEVPDDPAKNLVAYRWRWLNRDGGQELLTANPERAESILTTFGFSSKEDRERMIQAASTGVKAREQTGTLPENQR